MIFGWLSKQDQGWRKSDAIHINWNKNQESDQIHNNIMNFQII